MKDSIILFLFLIPAFLFAQYPTTGNKSRLGWQTTGDGLIWRGVAGDTVNKPNNRNYPYFQLDTVNAVLYRYIQTRGQWQAVGGGSIDIDSLIYATRFWVNSNFFPLQGGTLTGTAGAGFINFPIQSSPPATPSTGFSLYAGSTGNNISWMQPDGFFRRLVSPVTGTPRQYQFMARSYTLGDSADIANNITSIAANYLATSNGTNLVARNLFDNNTYVGVLNSRPWQFGQWTTAGRPSGVNLQVGANTTTNFIEGYFTSQWENFITSIGASSGQVGYFTSAGKITGSNNLFWDNTNGRLGVGTNAPSYTADLVKSSGVNYLRVKTNSNASGSDSRVRVQSNTDDLVFADFGKLSTGTPAYKIIGSGDGYLYNSTLGTSFDFVILNDNSGGKIKFGAGGASTAQMTINTNGNLLIGTTTDVATSILTARSTTKSVSPFPIHSTAESNAITGVENNWDWETGQGLRGYDGTRKFYVPESVVPNGTNTYIPYWNSNGQLDQNARFRYNSSTNEFAIDQSPGFYEAGLYFDPLGGGNAGVISYVGAQSYTPGLVISSNKYIQAYNASMAAFVNTTAIGPSGNYFGVRSTSPAATAIGTQHISIGGQPMSVRFTQAALLSAQDGQYGTTPIASPLHIRGGNASGDSGGGGRGGDLLLYGGLKFGSTSYSIDGHIILQHNGSSALTSNVGVKTVDPTQDLDINGDAYIRDSLRVGSLPNQTTATKILSADANGWVGYRAFSDFASTWLKTELEAGRDVDITGGTSTDFRLRSNTRMQVDGKFKIGSDSSFVHDPAQDTTFYKGNVKQNGFIYTQAGTNATRDFSNIFYMKSDGAYSVAGTNYANPGVGKFNWFILNDQRNFGEDGFGIKNENLQNSLGPPSYTTLFTIRNNGNLELGYPYYSHYTRVNSDTFMVNNQYLFAPSVTTSTFYSISDPLYAKTVSNYKFYVGADSTLKFDPVNDQLRLRLQGQGNMEAADLGKTQSNYVAGWATDGTVLDLERKRDTTIYIDDTDYDWSAAITTAQIARRFNRVIFWMTTTAAAGSDSELTLHTPDANLLQVEYLIHSVDEPAGFDNKIVFGTNNAVDSTNGLVTNYYPAAGDGIHVRAGLRSGVYKYRYSN